MEEVFFKYGALCQTSFTCLLLLGFFQHLSESYGRGICAIYTCCIYVFVDFMYLCVGHGGVLGCAEGVEISTVKAFSFMEASWIAGCKPPVPTRHGSIGSSWLLFAKGPDVLRVDVDASAGLQVFWKRREPGRVWEPPKGVFVSSFFSQFPFKGMPSKRHKKRDCPSQ